MCVCMWVCCPPVYRAVSYSQSFSVVMVSFGLWLALITPSSRLCRDSLVHEATQQHCYLGSLFSVTPTPQHLVVHHSYSKVLSWTSIIWKLLQFFSLLWETHTAHTHSLGSMWACAIACNLQFYKTHYHTFMVITYQQDRKASHFQVSVH